MTGNGVTYTYGTSGRTEDGAAQSERRANLFVFPSQSNVPIHTAVDGRYYSYYAYDYAGERTIKLTGRNSVLDVNADLMRTASVLSEITIYPSSYVVLYSIEKDECTFRTRSIDYENTDQKIDCRTYHLYCSNDKIGEQIFIKIASLGSPVEWDYYSVRVNEEIYGDLSSSGIEDKMVHSRGMYTAKNVLLWDHYHPNNSSDSFYPSHTDQDHVKLLKGARCTIFHGGKSMDFQNYVPTGDNKYISFKAFSEIWYKFAR